MRTIYFYVYFFGFLIYSLIPLQKLKRLAQKQDRSEEDNVLIHQIPKQWAGKLNGIAGADVSVSGADKMPKGAVLLVANHEGNFDIPILLGSLSKPFGFISKKEVKKIPIVAKWMRIMPCVFMDRSNRRLAIAAIHEGTALLKNGHSILVFPEGTRSKGGKPGDFKSGSLRLAKNSNVPIVPVSIRGTSKLMEENGGWIKPDLVQVQVLDPIMPHEYEKQDLKDLTADLQNRIRQVSI